MKCIVDDCSKSARYQIAGYCDMHYQRKRLGKPLTGLARTRRGQENANTLQPVLHPTIRDIAWAAGFLEGEGTFTQHAGCTTVSAVQVNKEPVQRLIELFGGSAKQYKLHRRENNKPVRRWSVSGTKGRGLAMTVYLLMSEKRKTQIRHALHPTKYPKYVAT